MSRGTKVHNLQLIIPTLPFLFLFSVLCGSEELSGVQAETEGSRLQVLPHQQQIAGQPLQRLHHQQGDTRAHNKSRPCSSFTIPTRYTGIRTPLIHQYFCLPHLAGSRQTSAGCRHQSAKSCCFQRCGECVWLYFYLQYIWKNIFKWSVYSVLFLVTGWQ